MSRAIPLLLPGIILAACNRTGGIQEEFNVFPVAEVSSTWVEFGDVGWGESVTQRIFLTNQGDLPMGVGEISLGTGEMEDNFQLSVDFSGVVCPGGGSGGDDGGGDDGDDGGDTAAAEGLPQAPSTALEDTGDYYTDYGTTDSGNSGGGSGERVLEAGCRLPIDITMSPERIGDIYGSVRITTVSEVVDTDEDPQATPSFLADPDNGLLVVVLQGNGSKGAPNIFVSPRALNFGSVWEGDSVSMLVDVQNTGEGDLTLEAPYLDDSCEEGFSIDWTYGDDFLLLGGNLTGVEVTFAPESDDGVTCTLWVKSDDPDEPFIDVPIQGNVGTDPDECAPTINLISPTIGYEHLTGSDVPVVFEVLDCNEPAQNLRLSIRSGVLSIEDPILVETFYAPDESGYVETTIPRQSLGRGTDTIIVRAQDSAGNRTDATTTVLYRTTYPASDDDGDGYGTDEGDNVYDCDDSDANTYPAAQEIYDGKDNDCDGTIDEGTEGYDDDGDGFSEAEGDCDDRSDETYPGAAESPDYRDNDCDGDIDEGTTLADDDGDGYAESEGDCNDADDQISPVATEFCDGVDNDCNGISDERDGCVDVASTPIIIGGIQPSATAMGLGESITLTAFVYEADGDSVSYSWQQDPVLTQRGHVGIDQPGAVTVTFTAPAAFPDDRTVSETYTVTLRVSDPTAGYDYDDIDITVYAEPVALTDQVVEQLETGCGKDDDASDATILLVPGLVGLLALARRRREDD